MDDEHRRWFCERYAYYCQKEREEKTLILS